MTTLDATVPAAQTGPAVRRIACQTAWVLGFAHGGCRRRADL